MKKIFFELMNLRSAKDGGVKTFFKIFKIAFLVITFFTLVIIGATLIDLPNSVNLQPDLAKFGDIGDFLGGVLNPILAFLVLLVLLGTTRLQKEELNQTRKQLRKSTKAHQQANIENAFFQLFNLLQQNLQTVEVETRNINGKNKINSGARGFETIAREILSSLENYFSEESDYEYHSRDPDTQGPNGWNEILKAGGDAYLAMRDILLRNYEYFYNKYQADLGRYYRLLYNVLKFLSEKKDKIPDDMYETYYKIVRASLSNYELFIIMMNGLTSVGKPMKKYISQFELFDNLPRSIHIVPYFDEHGNRIGEVDLAELWGEFDRKSFGNNPDLQTVISDYNLEMN